MMMAAGLRIIANSTSIAWGPLMTGLIRPVLLLERSEAAGPGSRAIRNLKVTARGIAFVLVKELWDGTPKYFFQAA